MRRGRRSTYQIDMRKAAQLAEAEEWSALSTLLNGYRPAAGEADLRNWEWHFLDSLARKKRLVDRQELVIQGPGAGIRQLAWSGGGERLAIVGEDGEVVLRDSKTGKDLRRIGRRGQMGLFRPGRPAAHDLLSEWHRQPLAGRPGAVAPVLRARRRAVRFPSARLQPRRPDGWRSPSTRARRPSTTPSPAWNGTASRGIRASSRSSPGTTRAQRLATGGSDGLIKVWDAGDREGDRQHRGGRQRVRPDVGRRRPADRRGGLAQGRDAPCRDLGPGPARAGVPGRHPGRHVSAQPAAVGDPAQPGREAHRHRERGRHHRLGQGHGPADLPGQGGLAVHPTGRLRPPGPSLGGRSIRWATGPPAGSSTWRRWPS